MSARRRAESCFALARSTSFPAERETAIQRGVAVAVGAGLDLDTFDIPGRPRRAHPAGVRFGRYRAPESYSRDDLREVMSAFRAHTRGVNDALREFEEKLRARERAEGARPGESLHEAARRNFDQATREARMRDETRP